MDDEKAVEVMARALRVPDRNGVTAEELAALCVAAIRAQGGEVVFWRPASEATPENIGAKGYANWSPNGVRTHFAILRGPEVKP